MSSSISASDSESDRSRAEPKPLAQGDCDGPNSTYVKLISSDNHEFIIKREYAFHSGTIRAMLSGPG